MRSKWEEEEEEMGEKDKGVWEEKEKERKEREGEEVGEVRRRTKEVQKAKEDWGGERRAGARGGK